MTDTLEALGTERRRLMDDSDKAAGIWAAGSDTPWGRWALELLARYAALAEGLEANEADVLAELGFLRDDLARVTEERDAEKVRANALASLCNEHVDTIQHLTAERDGLRDAAMRECNRTCIHHTDAERAAIAGCPVCLMAEKARAVDTIQHLTAERDELRASIELAAEDALSFFRNANDGVVYPAILVSDTFYYACADAEQVDWSLLPTLLAEYRAEGWVPLVKRVAEKRGLAPIPEIRDAIGAHDRLSTELAELRQAHNTIVEVYKIQEKGLRDQVNQLTEELAVAQREIETDDELLADSERILTTILCPEHGPCVPHVLQELRRLHDALAAAERELERWRHGTTVPEDFVCPDGPALAAAQAALTRCTACGHVWADMSRTGVCTTSVLVFADNCRDTTRMRCGCPAFIAPPAASEPPHD